MGTPALPELGKHCSLSDCRQIDFLPFSCDRCRQVFCLEHRSYTQHKCPKADAHGVSVVVCPLCAKGVRLVPDQDPNITWETHVNTSCDPTNYHKATKKRRCPVVGCKEILVFSNTVNCKVCAVDHCLNHRFGPDHKCAGPPPHKPHSGFHFINFLNTTNTSTRHEQSSSSSSAWSRLVNAASAGMSKLTSDFTHFPQPTPPAGKEVCPHCNLRFSSVTTLIQHVQNVHEAVRKLSVDVCPKCSRGFRDPVALVHHVEKDHGGTSNA